MRSARAVADVTKGMLLASVEIAAPPERVFKALASEDLTKWWGSADTYRTTKWTGDVRVGGAWKTEGIGSDGKPFAVTGEFLEVDPPNKLVQTWKYPWGDSNVTTLTYRLERIEGGTRLVLRHEGFTSEADCNGHTIGWERVFGWLSAYLS